MFTVMNLIADPVFREFQLVAGRQGIYNQVTGSGMLDWEEPRDMETIFAEGEFVVTSLLMARDSVEVADELLRALLRRKVSGIGIKTIFYKQLSPDVAKLADDCRIPIFFFRATYFDDIIYTINHKLAYDNSNDLATAEVHKLLNGAHAPSLIEEASKSINPLLLPHLLCAYARPGREEADLLEQWKEVSNFQASFFDINPEEEVHSLVRLHSGILLIHSFSESILARGIDPEEKALSLLRKAGVGEDCYVGLSALHHGFAELEMAIRESIFASTSGYIRQEHVTPFSAMGSDIFLTPVKDDPWILRAYHEKISKLQDYDEEHNTNLLETLIRYVECHGSVHRTAEVSFQHENTIRYRISRIKEVLDLEEDEDAYIQMYILVRYHKIFDAYPHA